MVSNGYSVDGDVILECSSDDSEDSSDIWSSDVSIGNGSTSQEPTAAAQLAGDYGFRSLDAAQDKYSSDEGEEDEGGDHMGLGAPSAAHTHTPHHITIIPALPSAVLSSHLLIVLLAVCRCWWRGCVRWSDQSDTHYHQPPERGG